MPGQEFLLVAGSLGFAQLGVLLLELHLPTLLGPFVLAAFFSLERVSSGAP